MGQCQAVAIIKPKPQKDQDGTSLVDAERGDWRGSMEPGFKKCHAGKKRLREVALFVEVLGDALRRFPW